MKKIKTSVALTQDVINIMRKLSDEMGISQTGVIEVAVRNLDKVERVSSAASILGLHPIEMARIYHKMEDEELLRSFITSVAINVVQKTGGPEDKFLSESTLEAITKAVEAVRLEIEEKKIERLQNEAKKTKELNNEVQS